MARQGRRAVPLILGLSLKPFCKLFGDDFLNELRSSNCWLRCLSLSLMLFRSLLHYWTSEIRLEFVKMDLR